MIHKVSVFLGRDLKQQWLLLPSSQQQQQGQHDHLTTPICSQKGEYFLCSIKIITLVLVRSGHSHMHTEVIR